jgi:xylulokinase
MNLQKYIIAHDLGTSGDKAILLNTDGEILHTHSSGYTVHHQAAGWAEQNPRDWWKTFCLCNRAVLEGISTEDIAGICITGQMMCCLPLSITGTVLHPAIIWADTRATEESRQLEERVGADLFYRITGMRASANYTLPKIMWLKKHRSEVYAETYKFLSPKDYLNYRLTGVYAVDPENAANMHCFDRITMDWSELLLEASDIDRTKLPDLKPAGTVLGGIHKEAAGECGLRIDTPVIMGTGDGGAATLGSGVINPGDAYTSVGTSSWVCLISGRDCLDPLRSISKLNYLDTVRDSGTMQAGGFSYSWLRDTLCQQECEAASLSGEKEYILIDRLAEQSPPGAGEVLFQPYLLGERSPYWDPKLRASFLGITTKTTRAAICRSVMEGVTLHLKLILDKICQVNQIIAPKEMRLVGGGAQSPLWRHIFADVYGLPIVTSRYAGQAGTLGTAVLAGKALGVFSSLSLVKKFQQIAEVTEPDQGRVRYYQELIRIFEDAQTALIDINHRLSDLSCFGDAQLN